MEKAVREAFEPLAASSDLPKNKPVVKTDSRDQYNYVWIKAVRGSMVHPSTACSGSTVTS